MIGSRFEDRTVAGRRLAAELSGYVGRDDVIVYGLPRGGVPVAYEVAVALGAPLDVMVVRKLGVPGHEELAMGAVASGGIVVRNEDVIRGLGIPEDVIRQAAERRQDEVRARERAFRGDREPVSPVGRTAIVVDDGVATGSTVKAGIRALRLLAPARIVVAVPVAPPETLRELRSLADEVHCLATPTPFMAVGAWYRDFGQTTDDEVRSLLDRAAHRGGDG